MLLRLRVTARVGLALALSVAGVVACGGPRTSEVNAPSPTAVIVDTDGGADDAIAVLYLLKNPAVRVRAITVSGTGLVHCEQGVATMAGLVRLSGEGPLPIACGRTTPLSGVRAFPADWRTQADHRYGGLLPTQGRPAGPDDAAELMSAVIADAGSPMTVVTLGPLTNLADALNRHPTMAAQIARVVAMAGAFDVPGNVMLPHRPRAAAAEWNLYVDPVAAQDVLSSGVPVRFAALDGQVPLDAYVARSLSSAAVTPAGKTVARLVESTPYFSSGTFFLWDPLAAAAATTPGEFVVHHRTARVLTSGPEAGRVVTDRGRTVETVSARDPDSFVADLTRVLNGGHGPSHLSRTPDVTVTMGQGCQVSRASLAAGPRVVRLETPETAAALGVMLGEHSDAEIASFLASDPTAPPPWFPLVALLQATRQPTDSFSVLAPAELTVVCVEGLARRPRFAGKTSLTVTVD